MKLLLYGGTFDPPHNGHLNNLRAAAGRVRPDLVVVMPAGVPPHKAASATPAELRLEMCRCFYALEGTPGLPRLTVSDWEVCQAREGRRNYTVLTLEMLARTYMDIAFSMEPRKLTISRSDEENFDAFLDLVDAGDGPLIAPATPGVYMYRIQADFGWRGSIVYFFRIRVQAGD